MIFLLLTRVAILTSTSLPGIIFLTIEIFKGPAGSMYGAGTGGLILLNNS